MTQIKSDSCCSPSAIEIDIPRIFINIATCTGCGLCGEVCPFGLPQSNGSGKYEIKSSELCIECSACARNCPTQAIMLQEQKGCGCLWDARARKKNTDSSCGCGCS